MSADSMSSSSSSSGSSAGEVHQLAPPTTLKGSWESYLLLKQTMAAAVANGYVRTNAETKFSADCSWKVSILPWVGLAAYQIYQTSAAGAAAAAKGSGSSIRFLLASSALFSLAEVVTEFDCTHKFTQQRDFPLAIENRRVLAKKYNHLHPLTIQHEKRFPLFDAAQPPLEYLKKEASTATSPTAVTAGAIAAAASAAAAATGARPAVLPPQQYQQPQLDQDQQQQQQQQQPQEQQQPLTLPGQSSLQQRFEESARLLRQKLDSEKESQLQQQQQQQSARPPSDIADRFIAHRRNTNGVVAASADDRQRRIDDYEGDNDNNGDIDADNQGERSAAAAAADSKAPGSSWNRVRSQYIVKEQQRLLDNTNNSSSSNQRPEAELRDQRTTSDSYQIEDNYEFAADVSKIDFDTTQILRNELLSLGGRNSSTSDVNAVTREGASATRRQQHQQRQVQRYNDQQVNRYKQYTSSLSRNSSELIDISGQGDNTAADSKYDEVMMDFTQTKEQNSQ